MVLDTECVLGSLSSNAYPHRHYLIPPKDPVEKLLSAPYAHVYKTHVRSCTKRRRERYGRCAIRAMTYCLPVPNPFASFDSILAALARLDLRLLRTDDL